MVRTVANFTALLPTIVLRDVAFNKAIFCKALIQTVVTCQAILLNARLENIVFVRTICIGYFFVLLNLCSAVTLNVGVFFPDSMQ